MAITDKGGAPRKGRAGAYTFYQRNGQIIMRVAHSNRTHKGRTAKSMATRVVMSNPVNAWRSLKSHLNGCFERQKAGQSEYNIFISSNLLNARVFFTQYEATNHAVVCDNFYVSQGSLLPAIEAVSEGALTRSNIALDLPTIEPDTLVCDLVESLVRYNEGNFRFGDVLLFVRATQWVDLNTHLPMINAESVRIVLDRNNRTPISQYVSPKMLMDGFKVDGGCLAAENREDSLVAWVRLRKNRKGAIFSTTQQFVGHSSFLEQFSSWEQREKAINSYGPLQPEPYLTPASYEPYEQEEFPELGEE